MEILGNFWQKIKKRKKNEPFPYFCAYLSISNLMNQSKTVKNSRSQIVRVCVKKKLTTENEKNCHFWAIFGKKSRKIRKKQAFFIFKSIIEPFKPDETVKNCEKVGQR